MTQRYLTNTKEFILKEYESLRSNIYQNYTTRNNGYTLGFAFLSFTIGSCVKTLAENTTLHQNTAYSPQAVYWILVVLVPLVLQFMVVLGMSQEVAILEKAKYISQEIESLILQDDEAINKAYSDEVINKAYSNKTEVNDEMLKKLNKRKGWETTQVSERFDLAKTPYKIFLDLGRGLAIQLPAIIIVIHFLLLILVIQNLNEHKSSIDSNLLNPLIWGWTLFAICLIWNFHLVGTYLVKCQSSKCDNSVESC